MDIEKIVEKFNFLFDQWKNEVHITYLDDTLLLNLNDVLESMFLKDYDPVDFLHKTKFLSVCKIYLEKFISAASEISVEILAFELRALGICLASGTAFSYVDNHSKVLTLLATICNKGIISYDFSIQSSLLFCLKSIGKHSNGVNWIFQITGIIEKVFEAFESPPFDVRRDATDFMGYLFINWYSEDLTDGSAIKDQFQLLIQNYVLPTIRNQDINTNAKNCSALLLTSYLKKSKTLCILLCEKYQLLDALINSVMSMERKCKSLYDLYNKQTCPEVVILLLADTYIYSQSRNPEAMDDFLEFLIQSPSIHSAMVLVASLLTREYEKMPISLQQSDIVVWPVLLYLKERVIDDFIVPEKYSARLNNMMSNPNERSTLLKTALISCKKILSHKNNEISRKIIEIVSAFFTTLANHENYADEWLYRSERLTWFVMDLIRLSTSINHNEFLECEGLIRKLLSGLFCIVKVSCEPKVSVNSLNAIGKYMDDTGLFFNLPLEDASEILVMALHHRHAVVIEGSLKVIHRLVVNCTDCHGQWINILCSDSIFGTIWDIAEDHMFENCVRAGAIKVLSCFAMNNNLWDKLLKSRAVNNGRFVEFIFKLRRFYDNTVIKAVLPAFPLLLKTDSIGSNHHFMMYSILCGVVQRSSDYDCQLLALHMWQLIADAVIASVSPLSYKSAAAYKIVLTLAESGYCSSLLYAVNDENLIVRAEALRMLLRLRKMIISMEINESSFPIDELNLTGASCSELQTCESGVHTTFDEKHAGINYVLNLATSEKIKNKLVSKDVIFSSTVEDYSVNYSNITSTLQYKFWKYLWPTNFEDQLVFCSQSSDSYDRNPISLLDDIITARRKDSTVDEEYLNQDCY